MEKHPGGIRTCDSLSSEDTRTVVIHKPVVTNPNVLSLICVSSPFPGKRGANACQQCIISRKSSLNYRPMNPSLHTNRPNNGWVLRHADN